MLCDSSSLSTREAASLSQIFSMRDPWCVFPSLLWEFYGTNMNGVWTRKHHGAPQGPVPLVHLKNRKIHHIKAPVHSIHDVFSFAKTDLQLTSLDRGLWQKCTASYFPSFGVPLTQLMERRNKKSEGPNWNSLLLASFCPPLPQWSVVKRHTGSHHLLLLLQCSCFGLGGQAWLQDIKQIHKLAPQIFSARVQIWHS